MANQNNPANPVPGGQNRNRPNNRPPAQKLEIKINHEIFPDTHNNTVDIAIEIYTFFGGHPLTGCQVYLKEGVTELFSAQTSTTGKAALITSVNMTDKDEIHNYRISLDGYSEEGSLTVRIPALLNVDPPKVDNDPELLILRSHHDGCGNFTVMVRVLKDRGYGLSLPVTIWYQGQGYHLTTDDQGEIVFHVPEILFPGDSREIVATVSGIEEASRLTLHFRQKMVQLYQKYSSDWFVKTNNGRAMILFYLMMICFSLGIIFGTGSGLLNDQTFRQERGLSNQEQTYNRIVGEMSTKAIIAPKSEPKESDWPLGFWKLGFILMIIGSVYGPLAYREEIKEAVVETAESIFDRTTTKSSDPTWEHLAKLVGGFHVARRNANSTITVSDSADPANPSPVNKEKGGHHGWMQIFQISMLGDLAFELLPKLIRKIFMK